MSEAIANATAKKKPDKNLPDIDFDKFKTTRSYAASRKRMDYFM